MEEHFFIKRGSLCFVIPIFTEESNACEEFFSNLKQIFEESEKNDANIAIQQDFNDKKSHNDPKKTKIKEEKENFTRRLKENYAQINKNKVFFISPNFGTCEGYNGRFLCNCVSVAVKFHDDISLRKNTAQFYLGKFEVEYKYTINSNGQKPSIDSKNGFKCIFKFNAMLYLTHEDNEKAAYLVLEINKDDIGDFSITDIVSPKGCIKTEQIIFIKHLFYKSKMKVNVKWIDNKTQKHQPSENVSLESATCEANVSLQEWAYKYIKDLCDALGINPLTSVPGYYESRNTLLFNYSFIELNKICDNIGNELIMDFSDVENNFLNKYSKVAYGMLLSDEGWCYTPSYEVKEKLRNYWTTRNFLCAFFLQHNALLFNFTETRSRDLYRKYCHKWFSVYEKNRYKEYVDIKPCLTGIDSLSIFPFLKAVYKEIKIERLEKEYKNSGVKVVENIKKKKDELSKLQEVLKDTSLNLKEIVCMEDCINKQFGIVEKVKGIKDLYEQEVDKLNFMYNSQNNKYIFRLTLVSAIVGLLSPLLAKPLLILWEWLIDIVCALFGSLYNIFNCLM